MKLINTGISNASVGNQPGFDLGGFPVKVLKTINGDLESWETLQDTVSIEFISSNEPKTEISIENIVLEKDVPTLTTKVSEHTAGRVLEFILNFLAKQGIHIYGKFNLIVRKGLSIKGTGLGSSAASATASLAAFEKILHELNIELSQETKNLALIYADFNMPDNSIPAYYGNLVLSLNHDKSNVQILKKHPNFGYFILTTPQGFGIKTSDARSILKGLEPDPDYQIKVDTMITAFKKGNMREYTRLMEEVHAWFVNPRSRLYPKNGEIYWQAVNNAKEAGALGVTISGSGPTIISFIPDISYAEKVGDAIYKTFLNNNFQSISRLVDIDPHGAI